MLAFLPLHGFFLGLVFVLVFIFLLDVIRDMGRIQSFGIFNLIAHAA